MDDIKTVMYVVFGVGYFIYNIYKKVKTPASESNPRQVDRSHEEEYEEDPVVEKESASGGYKTIDDIINDLNKQGHITEQKREVHVVNEGVENTEPIAQEFKEEAAEFNPEFKQELKEEFERKTLKKDFFPAKKSSLKGKRKVRKKVKFDLRKAVLYRAVMERPKY